MALLFTRASKSTRPLCAATTLTKDSSHYNTAAFSRNFSRATVLSSSPPQTPSSTPSPFNIWTQIRESKRSIRYTIYTGFALAVTAETTFWANVIYAKWFAGEEDKEKADAFLERFSEAIRGYRARWIVNYGNYWSKHLWGL